MFYPLNNYDLTINDDEESPTTFDDYNKYIKGKKEITFKVNWVEITEQDEEGVFTNIGITL